MRATGRSSYKLGVCTLAIAAALAGSESARATVGVDSLGDNAGTVAAATDRGVPTSSASSSNLQDAIPAKGSPSAAASPGGTGKPSAPAGNPNSAPQQPPSPQTTPAPKDVRLNTTGRTMTIVVSLKEGASYLGDVDAQINADELSTRLASADYRFAGSPAESRKAERATTSRERGGLRPAFGFREAGLRRAFR